MKIERFISLIVLCAVFSLLFCGCGKDYSKNYVYLNIETRPTSLDPQTASTDEELLIVRNIFEGLLRKNEKGEIVNGVCSSYSDEGLSLTFNLRENATWCDGTKLTADDFVFGFRRAVTPNVKATFSDRLLCIKNAREILSGRLDPSNLGVEATTENVLKITLETRDEYFLDTLTTSVCMPCNEQFFKGTVGQYGLKADCVMGNGSYVLKKWNPDDFGIRLYRNEKYNGDFVAQNAAVFISNKKDQKPDEFFEKGSVDCAIVKSEDIPATLKTGVNKKSIQNKVWLMTVSPQVDFRLRSGFVRAFSPDIYKDKLPESFSVANSIYPSILSDGNSTANTPTYNLEEAKAIFSGVLKASDDKKFPSSTLIYYENEAILPATKSILWHWQKNLSAFINISPAKHPEELKNQLTEKNLDFALFFVTAKSKNPNEYLKNFGKNGYDLLSAQNELLSDNTIIPIAFEDTNICYSKDITNLFIDEENGYIDFSFAIKK